MSDDLDTGAVLAVDLGGTNLRAGLLRPGHLPADTEPLASQPSPATRDDFAVTLRALVEAAQRAGPVTRVGVAVPGTADGDRCLWVPKLAYLDGISLTEIAGVPVTVANDAHLALLAEVTCGAAAGARDVVLFAIGTGIGSAVLAGGRIVTGSHRAACSAGWMTQDPDDDGHASDGWLERHAAGPSLDRAAAAHPDPAITGAQSLVAAAAAGDQIARAAITAPARRLGGAIASAIALLDPACVLLAGGVAASADTLVPYLREVLERHTPPHLRGTPITVGRFGPRAGLVGAAIAGRRGSSWTEVQG